MFYHDALTQLKCKRTKEWMQAKGYLKRWILPVKDLNANTQYAGRPVGNSPELMPLDCSLFKDVDEAVARHIAVTCWIPKDHPSYNKRFSRSSTVISRSTYFRILDPVNGVAPTSRRIIHDVNECFTEHIRAIHKAKGCCVRGLGSRSGKRKVEGLEDWGGVRIKGDELEIDTLHVDAQPLLNEFVMNSQRRHST